MAGFWKNMNPKASARLLKRTKNFIKDKVQKLKDLSKKKVMKDFGSGTVQNVELGMMLFYAYDPKWKHYLPLYDTLPLIIVIGVYNDGWLGLNLHYLPPMARYKFLQQLMKIGGNENFSKKKKAILTYRLLNGVANSKYMDKTIHRYLASHVRSPITRISPEDYEAVVFLPTASFRKGKPY